MCQMALCAGIVALAVNQKYEVWEDSFNWKECRSHAFMRQKLDYMHENPCRGKWDLAAMPGDYAHSSARFYILGEHTGYPITNFLDLDDVDLTKPDTNNAESTANAQSLE